MDKAVSDVSMGVAPATLQTSAQSTTSWIVDPDAVSSSLSRRGARLTAFLIDQAIGITAVWAMGRMAGTLAYLGLFGVSVIQLILLGARGQTIGKMALRIAIVDRFDKTPPGFVRAALVRQLPLMIISAFTPAFTLVYLIIDGLPIFSASRRCIHDRIAGTIVIDVPKTNASSRV